MRTPTILATALLAFACSDADTSDEPTKPARKRDPGKTAQAAADSGIDSSDDDEPSPGRREDDDATLDDDATVDDDAPADDDAPGDDDGAPGDDDGAPGDDDDTAMDDDDDTAMDDEDDTAMDDDSTSGTRADAGTGGSGGATECIPAGTYSCSEQAPCCGDAACVVDEPTGGTICAALCSSHDACQSGCCAPIRSTDVSVCSPTDFCTVAAAPEQPAACGDLVLYAYDGTFLGEVTSDKYGADSVCNPYGTYGSAYSAASIFDEYGLFGSPYGADSAYNPASPTPPLILCAESGDGVAFVSKNASLEPRLDPDQLCEALENAGL